MGGLKDRLEGIKDKNPALGLLMEGILVDTNEYFVRNIEQIAIAVGQKVEPTDDFAGIVDEDNGIELKLSFDEEH